MTGEVIDSAGDRPDTDGTRHQPARTNRARKRAPMSASTQPVPPQPAAAPPTLTGISHIDLTVTDLDRSEAWYTDLFGLQRVLDGRNDDHHFDSRYLLHPDSLLIVGLVAHDRTVTESAGFDEHRVGLDHLSLNVASAEEVTRWADRLDERGIDRSPIVVGDLWDVLVFRDPDNIQLELFHMKPAAAELLAAPPAGG